MARVTRSLSLDDTLDKDILEILDNQPNRSDYVKELVRADIEKRKQSDSLTEKQKEEVKRIVIEILRNNDIDLEQFKKEPIDAELQEGLNLIMNRK